MDFGKFSPYVETVDEPQVIEPSVRLLKALRFTGLVEAEFKKDPRDSQYKVIDINPRVWGWHTLSKRDRKSTRLNSSHLVISYAVFCLKKKIHTAQQLTSA